MQAIDLFPEGHPMRSQVDPALTVGGLLSHRRNYQDVWKAISESRYISVRLLSHVMSSNEFDETAGRIPQRMAAGLGAI